MTPSLIGRRHLAALPLLLPAGCAVAQGGAAATTPAQMRGPFYPVDWTGDADADLVQVTGEAARAEGQVAHLRGRLMAVDGTPLSGARIEIWQCDARGIYRHPNDRTAQRDRGFQGRGRLLTGADGGFAFRTIRPVVYPGRTPHIHVLVEAPGRPPLITQLYVEGEPGNARDGLFNRLSPTARERVLLRPIPADRIEPGALLAERDIILA
ncbi:dioxygenase family protein [Roseococcus suduntuyensis]|uniref:Protocatechuate 3,4-dioxygenase beta subunit n=1 Tax=Roseococcus suduntuyensis TaxID=455361 RepID=A0A840AGD2_9PROT|nr:intradiol ring-cleavage dioxygenase [Roseococcus suduntuyensis]MBB3899606.1 protocatechuate 3,4-dioxygenase beta subunit [Roseococcus suduntuyensis]